LTLTLSAFFDGHVDLRLEPGPDDAGGSLGGAESQFPAALELGLVVREIRGALLREFRLDPSVPAYFRGDGPSFQSEGFSQMICPLRDSAGIPSSVRCFAE